jgi:hypothetical protein
MGPGTSPAACPLCRGGHHPESPCPTTADDGTNRVGEIIAGRYELVRRLGAGGMGAVYEARHLLVGRRFALKLLHAEYAQQPSMLTRFQREARAAGSLENEHIAAVTDFGFAADGAPYLVMERLEGEDLAALLARQGPLPVARAVSFIIQACRGLCAAHANDIVHRDLKPANLFLTRRGDGTDLVKVLDFGIAKLLDADETGASITGTGKLLGTACYMPPEQAKGDSDLDRRIDIYALGAILYELLTATKAHPGTNYNAVLFHILTQPPAPIAAHRPDVPAGLARIAERAMAYDRDERYESARALLDALVPFAPGALKEPPRAAGAARVALAQAETIAESVTVAPVGGGAAPRPTGAPSTGGGRAGRGVFVALMVGAAGAALAAGGLLLRRAPAAQPRQPAPAAEIARAAALASPGWRSPSNRPDPAPAAPPVISVGAGSGRGEPSMVSPADSAGEGARREPPHRAPPPRRGGRARRAGEPTTPAPEPARSRASRAHEFDTRNPYDE